MTYQGREGIYSSLGSGAGAWFAPTPPSPLFPLDVILNNSYLVGTLHYLRVPGFQGDAEGFSGIGL